MFKEKVPAGQELLHEPAYRLNPEMQDRQLIELVHNLQLVEHCWHYPAEGKVPIGQEIVHRPLSIMKPLSHSSQTLLVQDLQPVEQGRH